MSEESPSKESPPLCGRIASGGARTGLGPAWSELSPQPRATTRKAWLLPPPPPALPLRGAVALMGSAEAAPGGRSWCHRREKALILGALLNLSPFQESPPKESSPPDSSARARSALPARLGGLARYKHPLERSEGAAVLGRVPMPFAGDGRTQTRLPAPTGTPSLVLSRRQRIVFRRPPALKSCQTRAPQQDSKAPRRDSSSVQLPWLQLTAATAPAYGCHGSRLQLPRLQLTAATALAYSCRGSSLQLPRLSLTAATALACSCHGSRLQLPNKSSTASALLGGKTAARWPAPSLMITAVAVVHASNAINTLIVWCRRLRSGPNTLPRDTTRVRTCSARKGMARFCSTTPVSHSCHGSKSSRSASSLAEESPWPGLASTIEGRSSHLRPAQEP